MLITMIVVNCIHSHTKISLTTFRARRNLDLRPGTEIERQSQADWSRANHPSRLDMGSPSYRDRFFASTSSESLYRRYRGVPRPATSPRRGKRRRRAASSTYCHLSYSWSDKWRWCGPVSPSPSRLLSSWRAYLKKRTNGEEIFWEKMFLDYLSRNEEIPFPKKLAIGVINMTGCVSPGGIRSVPSSACLWSAVDILLAWTATRFPPTPLITGWNTVKFSKRDTMNSNMRPPQLCRKFLC